jgi:hypothetical protein
MSKNPVNNLINLPLFCQVTLSWGRCRKAAEGCLSACQNSFGGDAALASPKRLREGKGSGYAKAKEAAEGSSPISPHLYPKYLFPAWLLSFQDHASFRRLP